MKYINKMSTKNLESSNNLLNYKNYQVKEKLSTFEAGSPRKYLLNE